MSSTRRRAALILLAGAILMMGGIATALVLTRRTVAAPPDISAAPIRTARTALGTVDYRDVGRGPTLLMITGFSASIDEWPPYFVDALAKHFRVIVVDNAGVGRTAPVTTPLSVPAMTNQTSALITALKLGRCNVLGWSMGGMIAQALATTHPSQVDRLILAATQPGTGKAAPVPAAAQAALNSGSPEAALALLFPGDQATAITRYVAAIQSYPDFYSVSAAVRDQQQVAIDRWLEGKDPPGTQPQDIRAPTMVMDGTEDALDPTSNDRMLTKLIHNAQLVLYREAGHGFLFQDTQAVVSRLTSFLR